jgi:hypothetical protein
MWIGYPVRSFACTNCGYVGHMLDERQLADLKRRLSES